MNLLPLQELLGAEGAAARHPLVAKLQQQAAEFLAPKLEALKKAVMLEQKLQRTMAQLQQVQRSY